MKNYIIPVLLSFFFLQACNNKLTKNCGKSADDSKCSTTCGTSVKSDTSKSLACKIITPELQQQKAMALAEIKIRKLEKLEIKDGYSFKFDDSDSTINVLVEFIKSERQCCDFFDFTMRVKGGFAWLEITGPKGAKEFIDSELGL